MASKSRPDIEPQAHKPRQDDIAELEEESDLEDRPSSEQPKLQKQQGLPERPKTPTYVAPIPKIGSIPQVQPGIPFSPPARPKLPPFVGSFLMGRPVDESGDIVDERTGQVLARAGGDLPSIVGRKVSNREGDILGDDGELLGYVADIEIERKGGSAGCSPQQNQQPSPPPQSLFDVMGRSNASLMVDDLGNILDAGGNVVGKFHDNNNPLHRRQRDIKQHNDPPPEKKQPEPPKFAPLPELPEQQPLPQGDGEQSRPPRRTEDERRQNAEAWRKEKPGESPSDIFLDVKSTTEGIQITIRIPTVFGNKQVQPNISFS
ncbi:hypothetical protein B0H63DRAFT_120336 [Podospora didyma]|uniref:Uncharacterized protein n=1 Tax=Podospora didyma TaxID=330526 RepID=A0AAE0U4W6_9PEZI|nr:hypothetical protein B0H63DRAFT_120336 [Podospora didyma]